MIFATFEQFQQAALAFCARPDPPRLVINYSHTDAQLDVTLTDDTNTLKYKTDKVGDIYHLNKLTLEVVKLMHGNGADLDTNAMDIDYDVKEANSPSPQTQTQTQLQAVAATTSAASSAAKTKGKGKADSSANTATARTQQAAPTTAASTSKSTGKKN
ncbi:hypothetical protein GQ42DRAFT_165404, partial [Ramicandelaber brevisporus]